MSEPEKPAAADGASPDANPPAAAMAPPPPPPRAGRTGRLSAGLALIVALVAVLASGYLWYELVYRRPALVQLDLPQTLARLERANEDSRAALEQLGGRLADLEGGIDSRIEGLAETQRTLKAAIDNLQAHLGRNQAQWQIGEAEQLLLIANRRLQLGRDVTAALAALRAADRQLERLANPNLLPVRREIAREVSALAALERADISGIALRLASLAERAEQLSVDPDLARRAEQVAAADGDSGGGVWRDLRKLVRIRRHDQPQKPLLPPEQSYFARQNLRLMLYGAQQALLQGNVAVYEQNLATAADWLEGYFDAHAAAVSAAREEIARLRRLEVAQELPDISRSLEMLRRAMASPSDAS